MRVNKAIRWGNLPSGRFMHVWKFFGFIQSQPADYSGALALVCIRNLCASGYKSIHIYVLCHHVLGFKAFCLHCSLISLQFKSLILLYSLIAQTYPGKGWDRNGLHTWGSAQTPGVLQGYHYGSTGYIRPARIKTKTRPFRWLNQAGCASDSALTHSTLFLSANKPYFKGEVFFFFFARRVLACSHWSAVLEDSCCDCRAQLNLKLLI